MHIKQVDERDQKWQLSEPRYRVTFWERLPPLPAPPPAGDGWMSDQYEVEGAEAPEVLAWALREATPNRTFTLWVRVDDRENGLGLVRLAGVDPTVAPENRPSNLR